MHLAFLKVSCKNFIEKLSIILYDNRPMNFEEKQKEDPFSKKWFLLVNYIIYR